MKIHPVAEMFPEMPEGSQEFFDLVESIRANGLVDPIVRDGDTLLDGRNRLRACDKAGVKPRWVEWGTLGCKVDKAVWIAAKNLDRRHLTPDQKAAIAFDVEGWMMKQMSEAEKVKGQFAGRDKNGPIRPESSVTQKPESPRNSNSTVGRIAAKAGVSRYKVEQAQQLSNAVASGELPASVKEDVKSGAVKLSEAVKQIPQRYEPGINSLQSISQEAEDADKESDALFQLKRWWKKGSKKDHKEFLRWVEANAEK